MLLRLSFSLMIALSACAADETVAAFVDPETEFHLVEMDGAPWDVASTLQFRARGEVIGQAPCNRYFAVQTLPYPWFNIDTIGATRMACPDLVRETEFFSALEDMTLAEVAGATLILTNDAGRKLVFVAR